MILQSHFLSSSPPLGSRFLTQDGRSYTFLGKTTSLTTNRVWLAFKPSLEPADQMSWFLASEPDSPIVLGSSDILVAEGVPSRIAALLLSAKVGDRFLAEFARQTDAATSATVGQVAEMEVTHNLASTTEAPYHTSFRSVGWAEPFAVTVDLEGMPIEINAKVDRLLAQVEGSKR